MDLQLTYSHEKYIWPSFILILNCSCTLPRLPLSTNRNF